VIRAELPGVEPDRDIDVSVDNGVLTIAAERQESNRKKLDKGGYRSEFRYGSFMRQVRLPAGTSAEVVSAAYKDGVLEIRMPKPGEAAFRRIQIQRGVTSKEHFRRRSWTLPVLARTTDVAPAGRRPPGTHAAASSGTYFGAKKGSPCARSISWT
jgi:HSP20 family protein